MKIFAVSDFRGEGLDALDPTGCDLVAIAGDFTPEGGPDKKAESRRIIREYLHGTFRAWCEKYASIPVCVVAGENDFFAKYRLHSVFWPENVRFLNDTGCLVGGLKVFGTSWHHGRSKIPSGTDVLVIHETPQVEGMPEGDPELTAALEALNEKPRVVVCGRRPGQASSAEKDGVRVFSAYRSPVVVEV